MYGRNEFFSTLSDYSDFHRKRTVTNVEITQKRSKKRCHAWMMAACMVAIVQCSYAAPLGRVAVIADGNYRDSDDICGTPVTLAIIKAKGLSSRLVHYSHSCDLRPGAGDPGGDFREAEMQISCDGTALRWGGFKNVRKFYNCQTEKAAAIDDLKNAINVSTATDPLWMIEAGEPDIMYLALQAAEQSKRQYVYIITHHWANDKGDDYDLKHVKGSTKPRIDQMAGFDASKIHSITDQNKRLHNQLTEWYWAREHADSRLNWLWDRGYVAQTKEMDYKWIVGTFDCSDAGMAWYWASGATDQHCDKKKLKKLFEDYVSGDAATP